MSVLVEGISVICRMDSVHEKFRGGWSAFEALVPNQTLCCDREVVRVGFMTPADVEAFVGRLTEGGLEWLRDGECVDIATADQLVGPLNKCSWLEFGRASCDGDPEHRVAICRLAGSKGSRLYLPDGWKYERSLSRREQFVSNEELETSVRLLRREGSVDVYEDLRSGKEVYVGRAESVATSKPKSKSNWNLRAILFCVVVVSIPTGLLVRVIAKDIQAQSAMHAARRPTACEKEAIDRLVQEAMRISMDATKESITEMDEEFKAQGRGDLSAAIAHHNRRLELEALAQREGHSIDDGELIAMTLQRECPRAVEGKHTAADPAGHELK
jgi:hypothetical protein